VLALTARRADTLKARAYDGDLARVMLPAGGLLTWVRAWPIRPMICATR
jgi:GTP cyclohydrolase II